ncbi:MAG: homoserine dehydrogenase, partial [Thermoguttaceae bacterium]|nr:homoserine dehydrogenase [Thermoguttaceae bacterium]
LQANRIESINAIVNGTSNFILSRMESDGADYADAVCQAQNLGYAEANPSMDVDGTDAVQKLTILAQLAFGAVASWKEIPRTGIDSVSAVDIEFAKRLGKRIRLLATASRGENGLALKVSPTLIPESAPLAKVRDAFNAVEIIGDFVGPVFYQGLGAGERPTASAVCSDVIDTAVGRTALTFGAVRMWAADRPALPLLPSSEIVGGAYLRMTVRDQPGVVAEIAGILGRHNISIASMLQAEAAEQSDSACLIILTHPAPEGALGTAVEELDCLEFNLAKTVRLAVGAPDTAV